MNQKNKDSLSFLLHQINDRFQALSRQIYWSVDDAAWLDNLMDSRELQEDIVARITRATGSRAMTMYLQTFLAYKAWQRTKAVYSFSRELVEDIVQTEDTPIYLALLERLPFRDMLFFFPEGVLPKIKNEDTAGIYVHIEKRADQLGVIFNFIDRINEDEPQVYPGITTAFVITNGMKVSQVFETPQYLEWVSTYKRVVFLDRNLSEEEAEECLQAERKALNAAINLMYYLSAENADIKPIKKQKKPRRLPYNSNDDNTASVKLHEVGTKYAEFVYRSFKKNQDQSDDGDINDEVADDDSVDTTARTTNRGKKRRPHVRRAHFQTYWTGAGRAIPVQHWISDLFVGVSRDDQATVVYDMKKEPLKGKRNPNTSKKKRDK